MRVADATFQAQWFFTLLLGFMLAGILVAIALSGRAALRMRREGSPELAAAVLAASTVTGLLFAAMLVVALLGVLSHGVGS